MVIFWGQATRTFWRAKESKNRTARGQKIKMQGKQDGKGAKEPESKNARDQERLGEIVFFWQCVCVFTSGLPLVSLPVFAFVLQTLLFFGSLALLLSCSLAPWQLLSASAK